MAVKGKHSASVAAKKKKRKPARKHRYLKMKILLGAIAVAVIGTGIAVYPEYRNIKEKEFDTFSKISDGAFHKAGNTVIYDKNNKKIGSIGNEKYYYVKISAISPYVTKGYVSKEDKAFYTHHGVSWKGTLRAAIKLVINRGEKTQGGSTITQQVVKNCLLTQTKTYERKIIEIATARQIEKQYTKAQIMEFYCNTNYYGNGCYGIEGASMYYFRKHAKDLSLGEAAMLVGVSNRPNAYNPVYSYSSAMKQKKIVISEMLEDKEITKTQAQEAISERPTIVRYSQNTKNRGYLVSYALHCATLKLMKFNNFQLRYKFSSQSDYKKYRKRYMSAYNKYYQQVRTGGYSIYTSLDPAVQKKLQTSITGGLKSKPEKQKNGSYAFQGAGVCIDNRTQMVVAVVGGRDEKYDYNRGYQMERQPGSAIKPLLDYGPGINEGTIYNGTSVKDQKTSFDGYTPKNADNRYHGTVTARKALVRSYNIPAVKIYSMTGRTASLSYLQAMKFSHLTYTDQNVYPVAIGGFSRGVTVEEMARGYATMENGGQYSDNTCIRKMSSFADKTVYSATKETKEVYNEDTSFMISDMLEGMFRESGSLGYGRNTAGQRYAGKTGTTNSNRDMWFCGYSKYYTTALWMGYDYPRSIDVPTKTRMDVWLHFMNSVHGGLARKEFAPPSTVKLRNIKTGTEQNVSYASSGDVYAARPEGWDYMSSIVQKQMIEGEQKRAERARIARCQKLVKEIENYKIESMSDAAKFKAAYQNAYNAALEVVTESKREEFTERLEIRYNALGKALKKWGEAETEYNDQVKQKKEEDAKIEAQKELENARSKISENRVSIAEYYIDQISGRTVYTETVKELIDKATEAVEKCKGTSEYSMLKSDLDAVKKHANSLPKPESDESNDSSEQDETDSQNSQDDQGNGQEENQQNDAEQNDTDTTV